VKKRLKDTVLHFEINCQDKGAVGWLDVAGEEDWGMKFEASSD
jgi:hypothetical protein